MKISIMFKVMQIFNICLQYQFTNYYLKSNIDKKTLSNSKEVGVRKASFIKLLKSTLLGDTKLKNILTQDQKESLTQILDTYFK